MTEREIKLHVEAGRRGRLLDALGHRRMRQGALSTICFDTADGLLSRHRFAPARGCSRCAGAGRVRRAVSAPNRATR